MSSTDPRSANANAKTVATTTLAVVVVHALVAVGLTTLKTPVIKSLAVTPPLEIEFITPPKDTPVPTEIGPPTEVPSPAEVPNTDIQQAQSKPTQTANKEPTAAEPVNNPPTPDEPVNLVPVPDTPPVATKKPFVTEMQASPVAEPTPIEPEQTEPKTEPKTEPTAPEKMVAAVVETHPIPAEPIIADNKVVSDSAEPFAHMVQPETTIVETVSSKPSTQTNNDPISSRQPILGDTQRKQQAKAQQTNNTPVNFGTGDAKWKNRPNIKLTGVLTKIAQQQQLTRLTVQLSVAINGSITSVTIVESSGNAQIDQFIQQRLRSAKLQPFTQNGIAVAGTVMLPIQIR